ncbi:pseudouridine-5'-phosphate glycosidase [Mycoplasma sp. P36-A1]|uniref:pseudouridine-5'-phosphate glycosidase n=1 Tax=Mycoplasma sp. P36-A1 TaxID=3252900 RepID=UPI003C3050F5
MKTYNKLLEFTPEIKQALENNQPIVALESTIISHGMPYPQNVEMAKKCEQIIRDNGAVPATICLMDGKIKIGLSDADLERLATEKGVIKTSRKDFGYVLSQKKIGATTVATTMYASELAGIKVFATGGIGGVHRGAELTFDISADLEELQNTSVAVICAGIKSILDLPKTLEYLETAGVEVLGYQTDTLPEFYTTGRNYSVNYNMQTPSDIAALIDCKWTSGMVGGVVITNPIPTEHAMDYDTINSAIEKAVASMNEQGIKGFEQTPFLLKTVKDITEGKSLTANIELVYNNAKLAALIAVDYVKRNNTKEI